MENCFSFVLEDRRQTIAIYQEDVSLSSGKFPFVSEPRSRLRTHLSWQPEPLKRAENFSIQSEEQSVCDQKILRGKEVQLPVDQMGDALNEQEDSSHYIVMLNIGEEAIKFSESSAPSNKWPVPSAIETICDLLIHFAQLTIDKNVSPL